MKVIEAIAERRSIRSFSGQPVEEEKLLRVLEAGRLAPSARNMQDWKFVVVKDPGLRRRLAEAARNQEFVGQAPVVIVARCTSDYVMTCGGPAHLSHRCGHCRGPHDSGSSGRGSRNLLDRSLL